MTVPGIVLFWGAAIPGGIPHIGTVGTVDGCRAPDTTRGTPGRGPARADPGQHRSPRVGPVLRQIASATGLSPSRDPARSQVATVSSAGRTDPTNHARRRPHPRATPTFRPAGSPPPIPRVAGASGPGGANRGEPEARDRSRDGIRLVRPPPALRALDRISADLLAGYPQIADEEQAAVEDPEARRARHRRRLARARPTRQSG